jgi:carboxyl-terminal processing protease
MGWMSDAVEADSGTAGKLSDANVSGGTKELMFPRKRARIEIHPVRFSKEDKSSGDVGYFA